MITSMIGPMIRSMITSMVNPDSGGDNISISGNINFVVVGASIMNQSFTDENAAIQEFFVDGLVVDVFNRATSGDDTSDLLLKLPGYLAEFSGQEANTIFFVHIGGNNLSGAGWDSPAGALLETEWREIVQDILDAGFYCSASPLTYRLEPNIQSEPFNDNLITPALIDLIPFWASGGVPIVDLYTAVFDNSGTWLEPDGTHPNSTGEAGIRSYISENASPKINQSGVTDKQWENVVVEMGDEPFINVVTNTGTLSTVLNVDSSNVFNASILITGGSMAINNTGRGNSGDSSISLTNDDLLSDSIFIQDNDTRTIKIGLIPFDPSATYTVRITASREVTASDRKSDFIVDGITIQNDATAIPPDIEEWTGVTGQALFDGGIQWSRAAGSTFGYLSGIQIIKE